MPKIGALKKNKLKRLFRFGFYTSLLFTAIFFIDTNDFYPEQVIHGFVFGVLVGILEEITSHRRYVNISLTLQFLIKVFGIVLIVNMMLVSLVATSPFLSLYTRVLMVAGVGSPKRVMMAEIKR